MKKVLKFTLIVFSCILLWSICTPSNSVYATDGRVTDGMLYNIKNVNSGKYLNVNYGTDANGTNVTQYTGDGSVEQKFRIVYYESEDAYRIYAMCSSKGSNRVLDVYKSGGSIVSGCNADIWTTGDDPCQYFKIQMESSSGYNFKFSIRLKSNTNLALTAYGTGNGSGSGTSSTSTGNVFVSTYTGANNQLWNLEEISATPAYPYRNTRGISNQTYYLDSTANTFATNISAGISAWNPTITLSQASTNSSTSVDFYGVNSSFFGADGNTILAATTRYTGNTLKNAKESNWAYSKVHINLNLYSGKNSNLKNAIISHEVGHAYGLRDYNISNTIMAPNDEILNCYIPQTIDTNAISYKY